MRFSVIVTTFNRADSLHDVLTALRLQRHKDFEVIVVNGPSTDHTGDILMLWHGKIRIIQNPLKNLGASRNLGLAAAAGEIVAFLDDDAIAEPDWLNDLEAAYDSDKVGGAGGLTYDHTGGKLQYRFAVCDRLGTPTFKIKPPLEKYNARGADPFLYLQGTNMSFRRSVLAEVGGFDEWTEHYYDDAEIARKVNDAGYVIRALDCAGVHHKALASQVRNGNRVVNHPLRVVRDRAYFTCKNGIPIHGPQKVEEELERYSEELEKTVAVLLKDGVFTTSQAEIFRSEVAEGLREGRARATKGTPPRVEVPPADPGRFLEFPTHRPVGEEAMKIVLISKEYPPAEIGGLGRVTHEWAEAMSAMGHELHVVCLDETDDPQDTVNLVNDVWVHRKKLANPAWTELQGVHVIHNYGLCATSYHECRRIERSRPIDVVYGTLWLCESLMPTLDEGIVAITSLQTAAKTITGIHQTMGNSHASLLVAMEHELLNAARHIHTYTYAHLRASKTTYNFEPTGAFVIPLGVRDRTGEVKPTRDDSDGEIHITYVGRLEKRKGADILIDAAVPILREFPNTRLLVVGKDTIHTGLGMSYRDYFESKYGAEASVASRVTWTGLVDEDLLYQYYANADFVVVPSRYESFGLVLIEAMQFSKAVIGCRAGGMVEIIEHEANGYLARPEDPESLREAIRKLVVSKGLRDEMGRKSREIYEKKFTTTGTVRAMLAKFRELAGLRKDRLPGWEQRMAEKLAGVIHRTTGTEMDRAMRAAEALIRNDEIDIAVGNLRAGWDLQDEAFVTALYRTCIGRDADRDSADHQVKRLKNGLSRHDLLRELLQTEEAKSRDLTPDLVNRLSDLAPFGPDEYVPPSTKAFGDYDAKKPTNKAAVLATSPVRPVAAPEAPANTATFAEASKRPAPSPKMTNVPAGGVPKVKALLRRLRFVGPVMVYCKRLLLLPWNTQIIKDLAIKADLQAEQAELHRKDAIAAARQDRQFLANRFQSIEVRLQASTVRLDGLTASLARVSTSSAKLLELTVKIDQEMATKAELLELRAELAGLVQDQIGQAPEATGGTDQRL